MAIDLLASEYSWGKNEILTTIYPDELFYLADQIKKRKLNSYRVLLAIVQNPYSKDPSELIKQFQIDEEENNLELDLEALENFKKSLNNRGNFKLK